MGKMHKDYRQTVLSLGCVCCAKVNRVRVATITARGADKWELVPLCDWHWDKGPKGHALNKGRDEFFMNYGDITDLAAQVKSKLNVTAEQVELF